MASGFSTNRPLLDALCHGQNEEQNEEAWRRFFTKYHPLVLAWCRRRGLQDADAEDVYAEVLRKLSKALPGGQYDSARRFRSWLKTVVDHVVSDLHRRAGRHPGDHGSGDSRVQGLLDNLAAPGAADDLADELEGRLRHEWRLFREALALVRQQCGPDSKTWKAFEEVVLRNRPVAEVAAELHMSKAGVYMAKARVITKLRQALASLEAAAPPRREGKP
jgi:RNA polymerase sigma-70 factor (ECF subfamily)